MRPFAIAAAILAIAGVPSPARAQRDAALDLARLTAHEAGLEATDNEVAAIHAVIVDRCNGSARCQSPRFFAGRTTRSYYLALTRRGDRPASWPAARFDRNAWLSLLERADRVVRGELVASCRPEAWGGAVDRERARRLRLVEVDCGTTANRFYRYPTRAGGGDRD